MEKSSLPQFPGSTFIKQTSWQKSNNDHIWIKSPHPLCKRKAQFLLQPKGIFDGVMTHQKLLAGCEWSL
ncbi:hypothetical protein LDENG_00128260 [Lucifuga dentata]|nr:hypothetical protein LDENG_00128260 [Lucifuga dentata]